MVEVDVPGVEAAGEDGVEAPEVGGRGVGLNGEVAGDGGGDGDGDDDDVVGDDDDDDDEDNGDADEEAVWKSVSDWLLVLMVVS